MNIIYYFSFIVIAICFMIFSCAENDPVKNLPVFEESEVTVEVNENTNGVIHTAVATIGTITYELSGTDTNDFTIDENNGELSFSTPPDFENPTDEDTDNTYEVIILAKNDDGTSMQMITVNVNNIITSFSDPAITLSVLENIPTTVVLHTAIADGEGTIAYSLSGDDTDDFMFNASSGELTFAAAPDFENPTDASVTPDNVYEVIITADNSMDSSVEQTVTITVTDVSGTIFADSTTNLSVAENTATDVVVHTAFAVTDSGTITYSLAGDDAGDFMINGTSGELTFVAVPDFEMPVDDDPDNDYEITITATSTDGTSASQSVTITVTNRLEYTLGHRR